MILTVDDISSNGGDRSENISKETINGWLFEANEQDWKAEREGVFTACFERVGRKVLMNATATIHLTAPCSRCLKEASTELELTFTTCFTDAPVKERFSSDDEDVEGKNGKFQDEEGTEASFDLTAPDEEIFDGRTINTDGVLSQEILVNLPLTSLCKSDCKGLCSKCGKDLNVGECGCDRTVLDPRWAALKSIKVSPK